MTKRSGPDIALTSGGAALPLSRDGDPDLPASPYCSGTSWLAARVGLPARGGPCRNGPDSARVYHKLGVRSRPELTAKIFFDQHIPRIHHDMPVGGTGWFLR